MGSYQRGTTVTLEASFINERTGNPVNPELSSLTVKVYKDGQVVWDGTSEIYQLDTGKFAADYSIPTDAEKGIYVYEWAATVNNKSVRESAIFRVRTRKGG